MRHLILTYLLTITSIIFSTGRVCPDKPDSSNNEPNNIQAGITGIDKNSKARLPVKVVIPKNFENDYQQVGRTVASVLGIPLEAEDAPSQKALNIGPPEFAKHSPNVEKLLLNIPDHPKWDIICEGDNGTWVVTGATLFAASHAALTLVDWLRWDVPLPEPFRKIRKPVFRSMKSEADGYSTRWSRGADGFDMQKHVADAARVGIEALEVNIIPDAVPVQVKERRRYADMYQWWCTYAIALDMYFESDLTRGTYTRDMLNRNFNKLKASSELCKAWGITPTFIAFEPRFWPERLYDKYPDLRGPRVDNPRFSAEPEYAPDINHPLVRQHYAEMMTQLMEAIPYIGVFSVYSQDSNAGFPWAEKLYAGPNGPVAGRQKPVEVGVNNFMTTLRDAGRKINPDLQLTVCTHQGWYAPDEIERIVEILPEDIGVSLRATPENLKLVNNIRSWGKEPQVNIGGLSNPWKTLGPILGIPSPWNTFEKLSDIFSKGKVKDLILGGGIQTEVFVPDFINNEVIRSFKFEGPELDVDALIGQRASAWTKNKSEAEALVKAWRLCDSVVRDTKPLAWTVNFISGRTCWRRLVKPIVPNQSLLTTEDKSYYERFEFTVGQTDPGWIDNFYMAWTRMVKDNNAYEAIGKFDNILLPKLVEAIDILNSCNHLSETSRDVRDRISAFYHMLCTDRNLIEVQEAIHACLAEDKMNPENSPHRDRIRSAMEKEIDNVSRFIKLLEGSPSTLIPVTSGVETTFLHRAPFSYLLKLKIDRMKRHLNDPPGPWFEELLQPGGWTSDLRDQIPEP